MESSKNSRVWTIALISILVIMIWFLLPQLSVVVFTALMAFVFYPLYIKLKRKKGGVAAGVTLLISFLIVLLPVTFVTVATVSQLASFAETASQSQYWERMPEFAQKAIDITNDMLAPITGQRPSLTDQTVVNFLKNAVPTIARGMTNILLNILSSVPGLAIALIMYIFLFVEFLRYGPELITKIEKVSPFGSTITRHYIERVGLMANAMVKGQLIISMIIAAFGAGLLALLGYGHYFFILLVIFTVLNFIPLGAGILVVPLALYTMFTGQFWLSLVVIVLYFAFGSTVEPLLRSRLMPAKIQLSVGLTMLATFCGIAYFGILGVIYGPIIMIIIITTFEFYLEFKSKQLARRVKET